MISCVPHYTKTNTINQLNRLERTDNFVPETENALAVSVTATRTGPAMTAPVTRTRSLA